mgnify:CR=1 FL=1
MHPIRCCTETAQSCYPDKGVIPASLKFFIITNELIYSPWGGRGFILSKSSGTLHVLGVPIQLIIKVVSNQTALFHSRDLFCCIIECSQSTLDGVIQRDYRKCEVISPNLGLIVRIFSLDNELILLLNAQYVIKEYSFNSPSYSCASLVFIGYES